MPPMGIFFTSPPASSVIVTTRRSSSTTASSPTTDRPTEEYRIPGKEHQEQMVQEVASGASAGTAPSTFSWGRFIVAVLLLVIVGAGAVYTAIDAKADKMQDMHGVLVHSFELLLGALVGLLTGESVHQ